MTPLDTLISQFEQFPGVGARQARRFAYHILSLSDTDKAALAETIQTLSNSVTRCSFCQRFTPRTNTEGLCSICSDTNRDCTTLLVVSTDSDVTALERSGSYNGRYFVLGGTVPLLSDKTEQRVRGNTLRHIVEQTLAEQTLAEIILGFPVNPDGENTARYVQKLLQDVLANTNTTISLLGRGLSTGSEIEYADTETIKNALQNRSSHP